MAQFSRIEVASVMKETGMIPLFFNNDIELSKKVLKACYDGGARLMEFTARGDFAHEVFGELTKYAIAELPGMIMGVGSVTDGAAASLYMALGANFIVTPVLREDIAIACNRKKVLWSPGCGTLTEIARAEELGCEIVKLFPGGIYGPDFVKAIKEKNHILLETGVLLKNSIKPLKKKTLHIPQPQQLRTKMYQRKYKPKRRLSQHT